MENQNVKELEKIRDLFLDVATIAEELIELSHKEKDEEDVKKELENLKVSFMIKLLDISNLG